MKSLLKPSIDWLLAFVPVAVVLRIWPQFGNETALFICSCFAVIPLAPIPAVSQWCTASLLAETARITYGYWHTNSFT